MEQSAFENRPERKSETMEPNEPAAAVPHARHRKERELSAAQAQYVLRMVTDLLRGRHRALVFTSDGVQIREEVTGRRVHPERKS